MHRLLVVLALAIAPVLVLAPVSAFAEDTPHDTESLYRCKKQVSKVEITLRPEIELKDLVSWVVGFTCRKFVLDPRIVTPNKKVTLIAPGTQSPAEAYQMFQIALSTMGLTVVPKGELLQIVESATSRAQPVPIYRDALPPDTEQMVRYLAKPAHVTPEVLAKALALFKSDAGDLQPAGPFVVITDHGSHVRDMASVAKLVDVPASSDGIYAIPVLHADATKLSDKLTTLLGTPTPESTAPTKLVVDERTNTLIVLGSVAAFERAKALVERLDIALDIEGGASMHVYQLGSAVAEELAKTLNDAIQATQQSQADKKAGPGTPSLGSLEGPARVISDRPTNKLIVMSSGRDFFAIREIIRELDVPRRQVYIEAMILEVQLDTGRSLGTSAHGGLPIGDSSLLVGGVQAPNLRTTNLSSLLSANGLIGGIVGETLKKSTSILGTSIPSYAVLFQALADHSRTNILSTMPIIVVDNEQAKYKVGTNVPYKKGVLPTSPTSTSTLSVNIERQPLLLELQIKPHISTDDSILLEVKQSSQDMAAADPELGPTWTEREIETRVLVRDQQTIVLGGLMQTRDSASETKVPVLGDIPLLGHLFKYSTTSKKKMNLLIMLTPYIIKDHLDLEAIRARKQREYEELAGSFHRLDHQARQPRIDYRRKRGLVEEINRVVLDIAADAATRATIRTPPSVTPGAIEPAGRPSTP